MSLIVDASVAVKWYLPESGTVEAEQILLRQDELIAPDLVIAEVGNALWKRVRKGEVSAGDAAEIIERAAIDFSLLVSLAELATTAMQYSARYNHPIYDCFYIALAQRESAPLVTADRRVAALAARAGVAAEMIG